MSDKPPLKHLPYHVGIIMDGNGRWARKRGLPRLAGHRAGTENLRRVLRASVEYGIKVLTIYAFSTENWDRPPDEITGLFGILEQVIEKETAELHAQGVRIQHIGELDNLSPKLREKILQSIEKTRDNDRLILNVALNYGGRAEIVRAVRRIVADGLNPEQIDEKAISAYMYTAGLPDPDLIIRTSGELRVSNFLIWQGAYAEYYVTPTLWPDFGGEELYQALLEYSQRERRFGRV